MVENDLQADAASIGDDPVEHLQGVEAAQVGVDRHATAAIGVSIIWLESGMRTVLKPCVLTVCNTVR